MLYPFSVVRAQAGERSIRLCASYLAGGRQELQGLTQASAKRHQLLLNHPFQGFPHPQRSSCAAGSKRREVPGEGAPPPPALEGDSGEISLHQKHLGPITLWLTHLTGLL